MKNAAVAILLVLSITVCSACGQAVPVSAPSYTVESTVKPVQSPPPTKTPAPTPLPSPSAELSPTPEPTEAPICFVRKDLDPSKPMVALTFDDGPGKATVKILDALSECSGKATFCVVGERLEKYSDTVKRMADDGHEIACHSWSHARLYRLSKEDIIPELRAANELIYSMTGCEVRFLRPPYGGLGKHVREACAEEGLAVVKWSVDTNDWKTNSSASTFSAIKRRASDGCIILCHDLYSSTGTAAEKAIPWLTEQGFELVTLSELMYYKNVDIIPGALYNSATDFDLNPG